MFCAIARGEAEASVVHADETVLAFMDLQPVTQGHLLVVPRFHAVGLEDLDTRTGARVWEVAHQLGRALRRSDLRCEGVNLFLADGEAAFQEVFHVHLHVFPRFKGDGFRLEAEWRVRERHELDAAATAVRRGLAQIGDKSVS
ncbi:HIT family protein [Streptomyces sp. CT34]|uniref:HIT family protein n=1 Tax=Streptomyces sp. CT34 TaxID=1553907 RepID=UPI001F52A503|nr:HIT family protein [Streptomyces sp. CT34]